MVDESSYDTGHRPFFPDAKRGYWATPNDFIYAGLSLAFRLDVYTSTWLLMMRTSFFVFLPTYLLSLFLYIIPFIALQSFMGQFSSSGFISAFRLIPLFKGVGYVTLALNICVVSYYSIFAIVSLLFMLASMKPTLPWSCEGFKKWDTELLKEKRDICSSYARNETVSKNEKFLDIIDRPTPSAFYFKSLFGDVNLFADKDVEFSMSWQLVVCAILVWIIVALVFFTLYSTERFGHIIRYTVLILCGLLALCLIRLSFLPDSGRVYHDITEITSTDILACVFLIPLYGLSDFGPGWGLFVTLSSFNKFNTNIMRTSWIIGCGQLAIILGFGLLIQLIERSVGETPNYTINRVPEHAWTIYLSSASAITNIAWPNFWSILFYFMLFLAAMLLTIIQLYTILTSLFDEFVALRECKTKVCTYVIGVAAAISLCFTSNYGIRYITALAVDTFITQMILNLFLIFIVLWMYGRERFQNDIVFMINENFSTWKVFTLRLMAPLGTVVSLLIYISFSEIRHFTTKVLFDVFASLFLLVPWISVPCYAIYYMGKCVGSVKTRFQRCCLPYDWYPVEPEDRQRYVDTIGNMHAAYQINDDML